MVTVGGGVMSVGAVVEVELWSKCKRRGRGAPRLAWLASSGYRLTEAEASKPDAAAEADSAQK